MERLRRLVTATSACLLLWSAACSSTTRGSAETQRGDEELAATEEEGAPPSEGPAEAGDTTREEGPVDAAGARELADAVARAELARVESSRREEDPAVRLPLDDYEVTLMEHQEFFVVSYRYANPNPPFTPWEGHGMHFSIQVSRGSGETRLLRGR
jgi:hypothetical protein